MPKQIKIGFDRTISPKVSTLEPLYDITGLPLRSENEEPLYTEEFGSLRSFFTSDKSLPVFVNNEKSAVKVIEQFPLTSQVSSSLLGVPRDEKQLGLFSDVSTYGFNNNIWEYFTIGYYKNPGEWLFRKNKTYGNRYAIRAVEVPEEQAISLQAFPVSWSFPYGPAFADQGLYNENLYNQYVRFFQLGRILYDTYINDEDEALEKFAIENFLPPDVGTIENNVVVYNPDKKPEEVFEEIEKWTMAWIKLRNGTLFFPNNQKLAFPITAQNFTFEATNTRPGYSNNFNFYGEITSRKAFRYQPGRISGFTFGLRSSSDQASLDNVIEWGCANNTDEYMFQVRGPNFSIVRRSTVPLPEKNLNDMGLTAADQVLVNPSNPYLTGTFNPDTNTTSPPRQLYETVISRDYFNNDKLDGNGASGYILNVEQVTMYKIEFSWYGAIGAKFYAYVPVGNGDARWVLIHTLVIENKIGQPCLNDPYFKFKYVVKITDTSNLVSPQFVYKYGASYYIDGGDEGASTNYSVSSQEVLASPLYTRSVLGVTSKASIKNKDGDPIKNKKDIIPDSMSITTDNPIRVDIIDCEGCPGFGHHYAPSLQNGQTGTTSQFTFDVGGKFISYQNSLLTFTTDDVDKKVIGDGIYSTYIDSVDTVSNIAYLKRKLRSIDPPEPSNNYTYANTIQVVLSNGSNTAVKGNTFTLRLTGYNANSLAVSTIPLTKPNIDVNFLNPYGGDGRSFADFFIGVTDKTPSLQLGELVFDSAPFDIEDVLYAEWTNYRLEQDYRGFDYTESDERYGTSLEIDPQIPRPTGVDSGRCSRASIKVTEFVLDCEHASINPNGVVGNYLVFQTSESILSSLKGLKGGQIGIQSGGIYVASSTTFVDDQATLFTNIPSVGSRYYIAVSDAGLVGQTKIAFKVVRIYGRYINKSKVFSFDIYPLYVVIGMRDNAKVNNITIDEYDSLGKFSYTPEWLLSSTTSVTVISSGTAVETINPNNGEFLSGGFSVAGDPSTNYFDVDRLSSALVDKQLQQPLRPGQVRSTVFLGTNESKEVDLSYLFGQDRYVITTGSYNTKATFFTAKALDEAAQTQITLNFKEQ